MKNNPNRDRPGPRSALTPDRMIHAILASGCACMIGDGAEEVALAAALRAYGFDPEPITADARRVLAKIEALS